MAIRYRAHLPATEQLSALPSPLRATYRNAESRYLGATRGMVRDKNDRAMDSKARHFASWLAASGFDDVSIADLREPQVIPTLVSYLHHVAFEQGSIKQQTALAPGTLTGYLNSAAEWLRIALLLPARLDVRGKRHRMLQDIVDQARVWQKPRAKREPYTQEMFQTLAQQTSDRELESTLNQ